MNTSCMVFIHVANEQSGVAVVVLGVLAAGRSGVVVAVDDGDECVHRPSLRQPPQCFERAVDVR